MRTSVMLDVSLLRQAHLLSGVPGRSALPKETLGALIQRESARRLAKLGDSEPKLQAVPRWRALRS